MELRRKLKLLVENLPNKCSTCTYKSPCGGCGEQDNKKECGLKKTERALNKIISKLEDERER
jgi:hypothetical protein